MGCIWHSVVGGWMGVENERCKDNYGIRQIELLRSPGGAIQPDSRSCYTGISKNKAGSLIEILDNSVKGLQSKYNEGDDFVWRRMWEGCSFLSHFSRVEIVQEKLRFGLAKHTCFWTGTITL